MLLALLLVVLVLIALGGGLAVSPLLWLVLIVALVVALAGYGGPYYRSRL